MNKAQSFVLALLFFTYSLSAQTIVQIEGLITKKDTTSIKVKFNINDGKKAFTDSTETNKSGYYIKKLSILTDTTLLTVTTSIINYKSVTVSNTKKITVNLGDTGYLTQNLNYNNITDTLFVDGHIDSLNYQTTQVSLSYTAYNQNKTTDSLLIYTDSNGYYSGKFLLTDTLDVTNGMVTVKFLDCNNLFLRITINTNKRFNSLY